MGESNPTWPRGGGGKTPLEKEDKSNNGLSLLKSRIIGYVEASQPLNASDQRVYVNFESLDETIYLADGLQECENPRAKIPTSRPIQAFTVPRSKELDL